MRTTTYRYRIINDLINVRCHMRMLHASILQRTEHVGARGAHRRIDRARCHVLRLNVARQSILVHLEQFLID